MSSTLAAARSVLDLLWRRVKSKLGLMLAVPPAVIGGVFAWIRDNPAWAVAGFLLGLTLLMFAVAVDRQKRIDGETSRTVLHAALANLVKRAEGIVAMADMELGMYEEDEKTRAATPRYPSDYITRYEEWLIDLRPVLATLGGGTDAFLDLFNGLTHRRAKNLTPKERVPAEIDAIRVQKEWLAEQAERIRP